ncbi:MAG: universal stress protein [Acidobacteria bacterium]|nr:universal stress protein [Acidobacteriota bacterium]
MFKRILVALDRSKCDQALLPRVKELARLTKAGLLLFHVSHGWVARWQKDLNLSDSQEIKEDREYLERLERELREQGFEVTTLHSAGEPADEILKTARAEKCDLIAMTTHGHRFISDLIYGTTITKVRHEADIPIFLVKARPD